MPDKPIVIAEFNKLLFQQIAGSDALTLLGVLGDGSDAERAKRFLVDDNALAHVTVAAGDARTKALHAAAQAGRTSVRNDISFMLAAGVANVEAGYGVRAERPFGEVDGQRRDGQGTRDLNAFFNGAGEQAIVCVAQRAAIPGEGRKPNPYAGPLRIRGSVAHLTIDPKSNSFPAASAASLSITDNDKQDKKSIGVEGAVGIVLGSVIKDAIDRLIPFVYYKNSKTLVSGSTANKLEVASVGVLYELFQAIPNAAPLYNIDLGLRPTATFDLQQDARSFGAELTAVPGISMFGVALGQENGVFDTDLTASWLLVYPNLTVLGKLSHVFDAGSSAELEDDDFFAAIGVAPQVQFSFNTGTALDRVRLTADYHLAKLYGANIDSITRYELGANVRFDEFGNVNLRLNYVDGEHADTLQDEKYWGATFTVKF